MKLLLLMAVLVGTNLSAAESARSEHEMSEPGTVTVKSKQYQPGSKYEGYEIDAFTTASKLAAQRSHTVAGEDERNFEIFTGITVVIIVYFLTQFDFFDR